ncbi:MAG: CPBP family intramembrane glutamic endopeptidase [Solirubrobacteraceae bacterium]
MSAGERRYDSPVTDWPWWFAPLGLLAAIALSLAAALVVEIPATLAGVHLKPGAEPPGAIELIDTVLQDGIFVVTAALLARSGLRRVRSSQFGMVRTPALRAAALVVLAFVVFYAFSLVWATLIGTSPPEKLLEQLGANEGTALLVGSAALTCVVAPICEEILFRGFVFTSLRNWRGPWPAAVLTGIVFGAVHGTSAPEQDLLPLAFLGFALCVLYRMTGSLYPCIAAHALNNVIAFGVLEGWSWQIPILLVATMTAIYALRTIARSFGLIEDGGGAGTAGDARAVGIGGRPGP